MAWKISVLLLVLLVIFASALNNQQTVFLNFNDNNPAITTNLLMVAGAFRSFFLCLSFPCSVLLCFSVSLFLKGGRYWFNFTYDPDKYYVSTTFNTTLSLSVWYNEQSVNTWSSASGSFSSSVLLKPSGVGHRAYCPFPLCNFSIRAVPAGDASVLYALFPFSLFPCVCASFLAHFRVF